MSRHRIILIRHARTKGNDERRYIGCLSDEPVSEEGLRSLKAVCTGAIPECDRVFSGPMKRCITTAKYLFPDTESEIIPDLTEMDFGSFEGKNYEELKDNPYYIRWMESNGRLPFPEGEDMERFTARSMKAFRDILNRLNDNDSAAIVCHGGNIMAIISALTGSEYFDHIVNNLQGYTMDVTYDGERIDVLSYERIGAWTNP